MTAMVTAAGNGINMAAAEPPGLARLHREEAKALVGMVSDALYEAEQCGHALHRLIYDADGAYTSGPTDPVRDLLHQVRACWQVAERYLVMLSDSMGAHDAQVSKGGA